MLMLWIFSCSLGHLHLEKTFPIHVLCALLLKVISAHSQVWITFLRPKSKAATWFLSLLKHGEKLHHHTMLNMSGLYENPIYWCMPCFHLFLIYKFRLVTPLLPKSQIDVFFLSSPSFPFFVLTPLQILLAWNSSEGMSGSVSWCFGKEKRKCEKHFCSNAAFSVVCFPQQRQMRIHTMNVWISAMSFHDGVLKYFSNGLNHHQ